MKRNIFVVLLTGACLSAGAQVVHEHSACDEDSINKMKEAILSEITVTGLTGTERMKDSPIAFSVISPQKLHQGFGTNIVDAIAHEPGISHISTGVGISKPVIRGLGYNRVVVVEQGIRQEGQQWGDEHGLEVDALGVHSVELLKGPASLMYGSDAIAGVMILHPEHPQLEGTIQARVGGEYQSNNGLWNYHAGTSGNVDGLLWNWHFSDKAAHCYKNPADGYVPGTWYKERDVQGMLGIKRGWGQSLLRFSHVDFTPGITEGEREEGEDENFGELVWEDGNSAKSYGVQTPSQRVLHTKVISDNTFHLGMGTLKAIVGYQQNFRREYEESLDEAELAMRLHTVNYDLKYQLSLKNDWRLATGINGMWQQNRNEAEEVLIPEYGLFDFSYYATAQKQTGRWHFSGGARIDNRTLRTTSLVADGKERFPQLHRNFMGVSASVGIVYNVSDNMNVRLNAARGFRAPTVSELSSNGVHEGSIQYELGNAALKSEYSTQIDLGMDYTSHYISINAALFSNWISNYIFLGRLPYETEGYRTYKYRQGDANLLGGEVSVDVHPINALHIENTFSYVRGTQTGRESSPLPMMPAPRWTADVRYEFADFAHGHCRRSFVSVGMDYNLRQNRFYAVDDTETATPDYAIFNVSAGMDLHLFGHDCIELSLSCQNFFDKTYQSHLSRLKYTDGHGIHAMGRNICLKVNVPLDFHM